MLVTLREINDANRSDVLSLSVEPHQEQFVGTVRHALEDAAAYPQANPWYRAIYAGDIPVGFAMISWDVIPEPPSLIGPWYLWKFLIDRRFQSSGYGRAAVQQIAEIVRAEGATQLLTSYVQGEGNPGPFYLGIGFRPTGERDDNGEIIIALDLETA
jgi:GNAT superfamily N-acetyltransferase